MINRIKKNKGFVLLYTVTLAAIFLSIAIGVLAVALKEVQFSTSARNTNDAFFAADTGVECALYWDNKSGGSSFIDPSTPTIGCNGNSISVSESPTNVWSFSVSGLDNSGTGCSNVTVNKTSGTTITADGYNLGTSGGKCIPPTTAVDRELSTSY